MTPTTPVARYELCGPASRIGCLSILLILSVLVGLVAWQAPRAALSMLIFLPLAPIGISVLANMMKSAGQVLETDGKTAVLTKNGQIVWRLNWSDVQQIRIMGTAYWDLEDSTGKNYRLIVLNLPKPKSDEISALLPPDVKVADKLIEVIRRRGTGPSYPLAIVLLAAGLAALAWGLTGIVQAIRINRGGEGQIDLARLGWQMAAFTAGVIVVLASIQEFRRNTEAPSQAWTRLKTLRDYIIRGGLGSLPAGESVWVPTPDSERTRRVAGGILLFAVIFWGSMSVYVVWEFTQNPKAWSFNLGLFAFIILFHAFGVFAWFREADPQAYTIHILGSDAWVQSESGSYPAKVKKTKTSATVEFSIDGTPKHLDPKYFALTQSSSSVDGFTRP